jgi:hypothetical protein
MAEVSLQQLIDAARRAEAAGNMEAANRLKAGARQLVSLMQQGSETETAPALPEATAVDKFENFGRGVTSGFRSMTRKGEEWLYKGMGMVNEDLGSDMLTGLNHRRARDAERNRRYQEQTPMSFGVGEFVGEAAALAPVGGVGATGARSAMSGGSRLFTGAAARTGTKKAAVASLAGEGAAVGAFNSDGEHLLRDASLGAATDVVLGGAINGVTKLGGEAFRRVGNTRAARRAVTDEVGHVADRIDDARDYGGYQLDTATAASTRRSLEDLSDLEQSEFGQDIVQFRARQNADITRRGEELVSSQGAWRQETAEEATSALRRTLAAARRSDERNYRQLYKQFDELAAKTDTYLNTDQLGVTLNELGKTNRNAANKSLLNKIEEDLGRYGIRLSDDVTPAVDFNNTRRGMQRNTQVGVPGSIPAGAVPDADKPLTLENLEDLMQDLNDHWSSGMSDGDKRILRLYRDAIEKYTDEALASVGGKLPNGAEEVVAAAREARAARRQFSADWTQNQIIDKITERTNGGEFAVDYALAVNKLSARNVRQIKARLAGRPQAQAALDSMKQAPLLEALSAALKDTSEQVMEGGAVRFNVKSFENAISKMSRETREALWGKQFADDLDKTIAAWKLRTRTPSRAGSLNPSNTAFTLMRQLRFLPSGRARNFGMAGSGAAPAIRDALSKETRRQGVADVLSGEKLPDGTFNEMVADQLTEWEQQFRGANGRRYGDVLRTVLRAGTVNMVTEDD